MSEGAGEVVGWAECCVSLSQTPSLGLACSLCARPGTHVRCDRSRTHSPPSHLSSHQHCTPPSASLSVFLSPALSLPGCRERSAGAGVRAEGSEGGEGGTGQRE
eukprot:3789618-Rhodomonas_salina.1